MVVFIHLMFPTDYLRNPLFIIDCFILLSLFLIEIQASVDTGTYSTRLRSLLSFSQMSDVHPASTEKLRK